MVTFRPTEDVARIARMGLQFRASLPQSLRGGTPVAIRRAVQLANRQPVSVQTLRIMRAWFARNKRFRYAPLRSRAYVAWLLWGGATAEKWVRDSLQLARV